mmetsp:Transcript_48793/g.122198  ORF Transcript_48793/g.122198 Transcript_48793/m.122198 type:complete len:83 (-) Transcript_48793:180-428(-)
MNGWLAGWLYKKRFVEDGWLGWMDKWMDKWIGWVWFGECIVCVRVCGLASRVTRLFGKIDTREMAYERPPIRFGRDSAAELS